jgi:hypothetical protein
VKIEIGARPRAQVERERSWWRENRDHPDLFEQEYEAALQWLLVAPQSGSPWPTVRRPHLLRVLLPKTGNHIYYTIERNETVVAIHSLWGARRRRPPRL